LARATEGYHGWNGWSRRLADILSTFIHADPNLTDISPLPQMLAALILGASTVLIVYVLCDRTVPFAALFAGVSLGLFPYFLENISYKFDAPYMALSIFFSIFPFIFTGQRKVFIFSSVVSLLIMCMTYHASSGIYILLTLLLCFQDWNGKRKAVREMLLFVGMATGSFCFSMIFFRLVFMVPGFGPVAENISKHYPVVKRLVPNNRHYHLYIYLSEYFHWGRGRSEQEAPSDMPVVLDSYYHVIRSNGEHIRVTFKH
jgi:hypothetical protein